jgi:hypothetical protein
LLFSAQKVRPNSRIFARFIMLAIETTEQKGIYPFFTSNITSFIVRLNSIDIQEKLRQGYGAGYEQWATIENLKRSAKTLIYINDSGIDSYEELEQKCSDAASDVRVAQDKVKAIEEKQKENKLYQQMISDYGRTRDVYKRYKESKFSVAFYEAHRADIMRHKAAKKYFDERKITKTPSINMLQAEWGELEKQRRPLFAEYKKLNQNFKDLVTAKSNASRMLGVDKNRSASRGHDL